MTTKTLLFANLAETTLALPVLSTDLILQVASGTGVDFPAPNAGQMLVLTLVSALSSAITEIVYCTNITGDVLTIQRAQENTLARNWNVGDFVANLFTAGTANAFIQFQSGTTAQRPALPSYVGQNYYDTTLQIPIWCKTLTPTVTWENALGTVV
jgi:hypothetical protein